MSKNKNKKKMTGIWNSIHTAIWLIGLAILAWKGWWWPGILVLVALSGILEAVITQLVPQAVEEETSEKPQANHAPSSYTPPAEHRVELLPHNCANCGAPIRGQDVKWTGPQSADCSFCGSNLPMKAN